MIHDICYSVLPTHKAEIDTRSGLWSRHVLGAAPGICFMEPAPATEDIDFLHIF